MVADMLIHGKFRLVPCKDHASEAQKWLHKSIEGGNTRAKINLGDNNMNGRGAQINFIEGFKWYKEAGEAGESRAFSRVGKCYLEGKGIEQNLGEAVAWLARAVECEGKYSSSNEFLEKAKTALLYAETMEWRAWRSPVIRLLLRQRENNGKDFNRVLPGTQKVVLPARGTDRLSPPKNCSMARRRP